jgi:tetratricopeptide (TPR) repeat protein
MTKDNLVYGLAGMVIGILIGVLIVNFSSIPRPQSVPSSSQGITSTQGRPADTEQEPLPEGHPPIDEQALRSQMIQQQEILKKDPENQSAILAMGNLNFDLKNYQEAVTWYEKGLHKDPRNVNILTDLGTSYLWLNQTDKALELYNKSLAIDPNHLQTLMNLGIARMSMGDRPGAAEAWEKVVTLYPENPEVPMLKQAIEKLRSKKEGT